MTKVKAQALEAPGVPVDEAVGTVGSWLGAVMMVLLSPLLGLLFVVCLPFVGFAALIGMLFRLATGRGGTRSESREE